MVNSAHPRKFKTSFLRTRWHTFTHSVAFFPCIERNLYSGSNGANNVFSFLPAKGPITQFTGDVFTFFEVRVGSFYLYLARLTTNNQSSIKYLVENQSQAVNSSQYLKTAQAGTEPTTGSGTLTTYVTLSIWPFWKLLFNPQIQNII